MLLTNPHRRAIKASASSSDAGIHAIAKPPVTMRGSLLFVACLAMLIASVSCVKDFSLGWSMLDHIARTDVSSTLAQRFPHVAPSERAHIGFVPERLYGLISGADSSGRLRFTLPAPGNALLFTTPVDTGKVRAVGVVTTPTGTHKYFRSTPFEPVPLPRLVRGENIVAPRAVDKMAFGKRYVALDTWQPDKKVILTNIARVPLTTELRYVGVYPTEVLAEILDPEREARLVQWSNTPTWDKVRPQQLVVAQRSSPRWMRIKSFGSWRSLGSRGSRLSGTSTPTAPTTE
ncbi:hypothetical protein PaG_05525 [Moesziomyces aphidis]|uniref:Uncharacterized protein n=1 Tax=Moesziomyces aphidis TaxID=84754 RepID=W3VFK3_MOEAP|nr:hypothetical protein PaG_05525 [Moesziomyces aphidis]